MEILPILRLPVLANTVRPTARSRNPRRTGQQGPNPDRESCPTNGWWGHELKPSLHQDRASFRVAFQNINGFNINKSDEKSALINTLTQNNTIDFLGIQEVNLHLKIMGTHGNWSERN